MPLIHSGSEPALKRNISTLMHDVGHSPHVQSRAQALAIAFANQRRHRDAGGGLAIGQSPFLNPLAAPQGSYAPPTPTPAPVAAPTPTPTMVSSQPDVSAPPSPSFSGPATGIAPPLRGGFGGAPITNPAAAPWSDLLNKYPRAGISMGAMGSPGMDVPGMAGGGMAPPWYVRSEARQMGHTGPIQSHVAGRTDHIPLNVPAGSYVVPADIVSGRGQGNSAAGLKLMHGMFSSGPFGSPLPKLGHGAGPPKPPGMKGVGVPMAGIKMPKFAEGGAPDQWDNEPGGYQESDETVPIMAAGGEYVIHPKTVWMIGGGSINLGHKILDHWVKSERQSLIKTLKNLPGPARD